MAPIVVEGLFVSPTQIELAHPVDVLEPAVEVEIRSRPEARRQAALKLLERMAAQPARGRTREDIQRQIDEERASWDDRR